MKTFKTIRKVIAMAVLSLLAVGCNSKDGEVLEELAVNRVFAPTDLTARIRQMTTIELNWYVRPDTERYVVEFAEGNGFDNVIRTLEVTADELPVSENFAGETLYSVRVKGVTEGKQDSKWVSVSIMTDPEQIFLPPVDGDIQATTATLRWPAGSAVTNLLINPGNLERPITATEATEGLATLTGLTGETEYTVLLQNNGQLRGTAVFTTLIDIGDATLVRPEDDISLAIANAADGDVLVLAPGAYEVFAGDIVLDKSISLRGLYPYDKPVLNVTFTMAPGMQDLELRDLELVGLPGLEMNTVVSMANAGNYNSVTISGCTIRDYGRQLIYGNTGGAVLSNLYVDNNIVSNFVGGGGDFIDFRSGNVHNVEVTNSTFVSAPEARDFIRMDAGGGSGSGITATVLIDHCTFVGVSNSKDRITYVRYADNDITVTNNIFADTDAYYSNQAGTDAEINFGYNNYFNAPNFYSSTETRYDTSANYTTLDPGFVDPANGDFTVTNQALLDEGIGDPRWH